jgi:hypothetical protein
MCPGANGPISRLLLGPHEEDDPLFDLGFDLLLKGLLSLLRLPFNEVYMETSLFERNSSLGILAVQTPGHDGGVTVDIGPAQADLLKAASALRQRSRCLLPFRGAASRHGATTLRLPKSRARW